MALKFQAFDYYSLCHAAILDEPAEECQGAVPLRSHASRIWLDFVSRRLL